ncbi:protein of unknown function [Formivibrio citricus]|uniref:Protein-glutamine gamma-glutamyltransferase-like C-terminal domain-containing protein n=1 Tax=Formivibrio citricus TaxID=83765 RepID=A0A1I4ZBS7_9NEIS|nr:DUF4129 domain-containing protein [Formivibrio citricus]SFN47731.1 protein of unknown function [Formivibrio citricus]
MKLEHLQLDLRPRPYWQAIDLGYALLRRNAATTYAAWWALWGPLALAMLALTALLPLDWNWVPMMLIWWVKPLVERIVIYVLSRAVFGEAVSWREAVRAWPGQLSGGWFRVLTWWRPIMLGRGLYQPIWQLEGARGAFAKQRRQALGRRGAYGAASWFGVVCAHFEFVIELGLIALLGLFISDPGAANPFTLFAMNAKNENFWYPLLMLATYALAAGMIGPVYVAGCFTLYLNRRAELEAWDIELAFRRLAERCGRFGKTLASVLFVTVAGLCFIAPAPQAWAVECEPPAHVARMLKARGEPQDAEQARIRAQVDEIYAREELRSYECKQGWVPKKKDEVANKETAPFWKSVFDVLSALGDLLNSAAGLIKLLLIMAAAALVFWLLYRYRHVLEKMGLLRKKALPELPQEIAGLDIRPETLPDDVAAAVWQAWQAGEQRAALALLYRASISRLAHRHGIALPKGATEGECLQTAQAALRAMRLNEARYRVVKSVTEVWQAAAYADRWPDGEKVRALCKHWQADLDQVEAAS